MSKDHCPKHEGNNKDCYNCHMHHLVFKAEASLASKSAEVERLQQDGSWAEENNKLRSALSESHARVKELTESLNDVVSEIPSTEIWFASRDNARIILAASSSPAQEDKS